MSDQDADNAGSSVGLPLVVLCALIVAFIPLHSCNIQLFSLLNGLHNSVTDVVWLWFTTMGDGMLIGIMLGCFLLINPRVTCAGLVLMLMSSVLVHAIKFAYPVPRPVEIVETAHVVGPVLRWNSFPSGHMASAFSAATAMATLMPGRICGACALLLAVLIGLSRVFVGAHFPLDILGGAVCALAAFVVMKAGAWKRIQARIPDTPRHSSRSFRGLLAVETAAALFSLFVYAPRYAESPYAAAVISIGVLVFLGFGYRKYRRPYPYSSCQKM